MIPSLPDKRASRDLANCGFPETPAWLEEFVLRATPNQRPLAPHSTDRGNGAIGALADGSVFFYAAVSDAVLFVAHQVNGMRLKAYS